ncbi:MAG: MHS family MFS transporter [Opitutaceae bacterium]|nr:MHS family MFS transporter [Opitutaceae bacterium]
MTTKDCAYPQTTLAPVPEKTVRKVATISLLGASVEWYDFFLYGAAAAAVFPSVFFSGDLPPLVAIFASFATFAVGFIARPVGGVIFGHYGDKLGRKGSLVTALVLMGLSSALIGLLPTYAMIGAWAPAMLVTLRFLQGIAIGGQWGGAMLLATESAPKNRRGFYGSFPQAGAPLGVILANIALLIVSSSMSEESFMSWGWRIPFLLSVILVGVALYVQLKLEETSSFRQLRELNEAATADDDTPKAKPTSKRSPVLAVLASHPRQIALSAGAFIAVQVVFYILVAFVIAYGATREGLDISRDTMLSAVLIGTLIMTPVIFISGALSDIYGRRPVIMVGATLLALWSFAVFPLIDTGQFLWITVAIAVAQVCVAIMYGPQAAFFAELFSTEVRYSGASLGYQLGAILGGAFAPLAATALLVEFGNGLAIAAYMSAACAVSLLSVFLLAETYQRDL